MLHQRLMNEMYSKINELSPTDRQRLNVVLKTESTVQPDDVLYPLLKLYYQLPWRINRFVIMEYIDELVLAQGPIH